MSGEDLSPAEVRPPGPSEPISPDLSFLETVERESGVKVSACFQCGKCSNGCPLTFAMDYHPYQVIRFVHLGLKERLVNSSTIWLCASCHTCVTRCPNDVDIPKLMDYLKEKVSTGEGSIAEKKTELFHRQFLKSVKNHGRVFEGGFMQGYLIRSGAIWNFREVMKNAMLGKKLFFRGRLKFLPSRVKGIREVRSLFRSEK